MLNRNLKTSLFQFCDTFVKNRISRIKSSQKDLRDALDSEDKNSSGDKHETGRAMLQLEQEKLGQQLSEAEKMESVLGKVNIRSVNEIIGLGSLVQTSKHNYFLAISAGQFKEGDQSIYCISTSTPMGQLLLGKSVGDVVVFNGEQIKVQEIH
ncbi:MAG: 3-oxoacyl-ACP synthase [Flavobacteriaceae bacterium]